MSPFAWNRRHTWRVVDLKIRLKLERSKYADELRSAILDAAVAHCERELARLVAEREDLLRPVRAKAATDQGMTP